MANIIINHFKQKIFRYLSNIYNSLLKSNPYDSDAYNNLAILNLECGNVSQSLEDMNKAITITSRYHHHIHYFCSAAYMFRGYTNLIFENADDATEDFNNAIFQDHSNLDAIAAKAEMAIPATPTYLDKLITEYEFTLIDYHQNTSCINSKDTVKKAKALFVQKDYEKLDNHLRKVIRSDEVPELLYLKAITNFYLKNYSDAINAFEQLLTFPEFFQNKYLYYDMGRCYLCMGDYKCAKTLFMKCIKLDSQYSTAYLGIGIVYFFTKHYNFAMQAFNAAIKFMESDHKNYHRNFSIQYYNRAHIHHLLGNTELCFNDLNKAIELNNKNIEALVLRAEIYIPHNNKVGCIQDLSQVLKLHPKHKKAREMLDGVRCNALSAH